jgi:hypothetical protein
MWKKIIIFIMALSLVFAPIAMAGGKGHDKGKGGGHSDHGRGNGYGHDKGCPGGPSTPSDPGEPNTPDAPSAPSAPSTPDAPAGQPEPNQFYLNNPHDPATCTLIEWWFNAFECPEVE